ncbi:EamA family transporter [Francisella halioticida]|uniref:EamA family transporter n=1 Tax=Francisella halioticida TaxID=549298 RepID=UPI001BB33575
MGFLFKEDNILLGCSLALISALFLVLMGYFTTLVQDSGISNSLIIAYRFIFGIIMLSPFMFLKKDFSFKAKKVHIIFIRSLAGFISMFLFLFALNYLPLANSMLLLNTAPLFTPIIIYF